MINNKRSPARDTQSDHETMLSVERDLRLILDGRMSKERRAILKEMLCVCEVYRGIALNQQ